MAMCNSVFAAMRVVARKQRLTCRNSSTFRQLTQAALDLRADVAAGTATFAQAASSDGEFDAKLGHLRR